MYFFTDFFPLFMTVREMERGGTERERVALFQTDCDDGDAFFSWKENVENMNLHSCKLCTEEMR